MPSLGSILESLRRDSGFGLRELCRRAEASSLVASPISPAYLSRLERGAGDITEDKISIDSLWGVGVALGVDPLALFVASRKEVDQSLRDNNNRLALFPVGDVPDVAIGVCLRGFRTDRMLSLAEVSRLASTLPNACYGMSPGFLSQVETNFRGLSDKISGEKLWALGVVFGVCPLALYVLSRRINRGLNLRERRSALFRRFSV